MILLLSAPLACLAQSVNCTFKPPVFTIHFGSGNARDVNTESLYNYSRVSNYCPTDGHYTYTSYTSDCFRGDWFTLTEDHTPGDANGNMLLINASYNSGTFLKTPVIGLKSNTTYEFAVWMMNVCKISDKCPFPLLPNINIQLLTTEGRGVVQLKVGEVPRTASPSWSRYSVLFTTPPSTGDLTLVMMNYSPGGCGNDFAVDDITFRECIKPPLTTPAVNKTTATKKQPPVIVAATAKNKSVDPKPVPPKPVEKKPVEKKPVEKKPVTTTEVKKPVTTTEVKQPAATTVKLIDTPAISKPVKKIFASPPPVLRMRENALEKRIITEAGEIRIDLYDNGEIDGDTVSIYHNNVLLKSRARLTQNAITIRIAINAEQPHHELIMVAENLGSIPPNTSLMVVNAGNNRYEVRISSNEQKNAKVVFDLKE